jgi:hypothetical protein
MRICVVTPSEEFSVSAGVRIRYDRLATAARLSGHEVTLQPIAEFQSRGDFTHDAYVFAKTYSAVATLLAWRMRQDGRLVGLDIFDDYFSQRADSRLLRYRHWLAEMREAADFLICSTPKLAEAISPFSHGLPLLVIADPSEAVDPLFADYIMAKKIARRAAEKTIRVLWFGIGDNPFFPVGLRDLSAYGAQLAAFGAGESRAKLRILTNTRALTADGLASLRRLPLPYMIEEWTPERERGEMLEADVCFLPVNAQPFSQVKSLNRAITALTSGCQVLSAGFPLYDELGQFVYRSAGELRDDLMAGREKLRADTLGALVARLAKLANPYRSAAQLISLLGGLQVRPAEPASGQTVSPHQANQWPEVPKFAADLGVVHGAQPEGRLHKLVQRFNGIAVKGPLCREEWNCHVRFDAIERGRLRVLVATGAVPVLAEQYRSLLRPFGKLKDFDFQELKLENAELETHATGWPPCDPPSAIRMYATAPRFAGGIMDICRTIMPTVRFLPNEKLLAVAPALSGSI